ncbi:MAG: hypothetical protein HY568_02040 [Candidatus Latescibacteria bacterium]|nr:hypothetical protein [Candidatus Latescibacterota bacterium]
MRSGWSMFAERRAGARALLAPALAACAVLAGSVRAAPPRSEPWNPAASLSSEPAPRTLRLVWGTSEEDPARALDRLARAGFHVAVSVPPHVYYVLGRSTMGAALPEGFAFAAVPEGGADPGGAAIPGHATHEGPTFQGGDLFGGVADVLAPVGSPGGTGAWTPRAAPARTPGAAPSGNLAGLPYGARWFDTSEFMIGRIAVSILFPESDGTIDPNRYDWTPALRDSVVRAAVRGLAHWSVFAARRGVPVSFVIEVHPGLATRYEPIDRTVAEEKSWIRDALVSLLGYQGDAITLSYDVANAARARLGAQWAALIFAVQNDADPDGAFPDGVISHAELGGPYFVTPIKNGFSAFQGATLDTYIEHEMAHTFWALDEHLPFSGWWACSYRTGYLNQPNWNSLVPAAGYCWPIIAQCLMKGNYPDSVCTFTEAQIGWADRNLNGVPDLVETRPAAFPDSEQYRATAGPPVTLTGSAREIPVPNENPWFHYGYRDTISIATIDSVRFRVNNGPPQSAEPTDGVFDSGRESFRASLGALPAGTYLVDWDVWNSNGLSNLTAPTTTVTLSAPSAPAGVDGGAATPRGISLRLGPSPGDGSVRFLLRGEAGAEGHASVFDVAGRLVARWTVRVPSTGVSTWAWDGADGDGAPVPSGLYFATVELAGRTITRRLVVAR